jgi:phosphoglycerate dehydrogenase-like enzyme
MTRPHILVSVPGLFEPEQEAALAEAAAGWATIEWLAHDAPETDAETAVARADVVIGAPPPEWLLRGRARVVLLPSHGYEHYEGVGLEAKPDLVVCKARGAIGVACAEHALSLMFALARRLPEHVRDMQRRTWVDHQPYVELTAARACVVGLGSIGIALARRLAGLELSVTAVTRSEPRLLPEGVTSWWPLHRLDEAVASADHVFVAVPGGPRTAKLFDRSVLGAMTAGSFLYNVTRGSIIDEEALVEALRSGHLAGAGLDVFAEEPLPPDSPLWELDNVLLTSHVAGYTPRRLPDLCEQFVKNLANLRKGKPLENVVQLAADTTRLED